jgi:hypothetical protein
MKGFDGSLAVKLDFGELATTVTDTVGRGRGRLRLAVPTGKPAGPELYRTLDLRRRKAQIAARHLVGSHDWS